MKDGFTILTRFAFLRVDSNGINHKIYPPLKATFEVIIKSGNRGKSN